MIIGLDGFTQFRYSHEAMTTPNSLTNTLGTRTASRAIQTEIDPFATVPDALAGIDGETVAKLRAIAHDSTMSHEQKVSAYIDAYAIGCTWSEGSDNGNVWAYETIRFTSSVDAVSALATAGTKPVSFRVAYDAVHGFYTEPTELPADSVEYQTLANPNTRDAQAAWTYRYCTPKATRRFIFSRFRWLAANGFILTVQHHKSTNSANTGTAGYYVYKVMYSASLAELDAANALVPQDVRVMADSLMSADDTPLADVIADALVQRVSRLSPDVRDAFTLLWPDLANAGF